MPNETTQLGKAELRRQQTLERRKQTAAEIVDPSSVALRPAQSFAAQTLTQALPRGHIPNRRADHQFPAPGGEPQPPGKVRLFLQAPQFLAGAAVPPQRGATSILRLAFCQQGLGIPRV